MFSWILDSEPEPINLACISSATRFSEPIAVFTMNKYAATEPYISRNNLSLSSISRLENMQKRGLLFSLSSQPMFPGSTHSASV